MYTRIEAPAEMPVTLEEIKTHCRIDDTEDDTLLGALIRAAYSQAEHRTGRALLPQTWQLDCKPGLVHMGIPLRYDTTDIVSVTWPNADGTTGALLPTDMELVDRYRLVPRTAWPDTGGAPLTIVFRCGRFASVDAFPEDIKAWIKLHVATLYENREAVQAGQLATMARPFVDGLLDPYVLVEV